jgi:hypothetical protein
MRKPKVIFLMTILLLSCPLVFVNAYLFKKVHGLEDEIARKTVLLRRAQPMEKALATLPKDWSMRAGFWREPDYDIQQKMQTLLQDHGATIQNINMTAVEKSQHDIERLTINAIFLITEEKWLPLLEAVESHQPYFLVNALRIHPQGKNSMLYVDAAIVAFRYQAVP